MKITNVKIGYSRRIAPAQYESEEASLVVDVTADVESLGSFESTVDVLFCSLAARVYKTLGHKVPGHLVIPPARVTKEDFAAAADQVGVQFFDTKPIKVAPTPVEVAPKAVEVAQKPVEGSQGNSRYAAEKLAVATTIEAAVKTVEESRPLVNVVVPTGETQHIDNKPLEYTLADLKAACGAKSKKNGPDAVWAILGDFGVSRGVSLSTVPAEKYGEIIKALQA